MKIIISKSKLGNVVLEMETIFILRVKNKLDTEYRDDLCKAVFDYGTAMAKEQCAAERPELSGEERPPNKQLELTSAPQSVGCPKYFKGSPCNWQEFNSLKCGDNPCQLNLSNSRKMFGVGA